MTAVVALVASSWGGLVVWTGWRRRPRRSPAHELRPPGRVPIEPSGVLRRVGRTVRRTAGAEADPVADRHAGAVVIVAALAGLCWLPAALAVVAIAIVVPRIRVDLARRRHEESVVRELPDVVDLLVLAVGAGLTVPLAVDAVARRARGPAGAALVAAAGRVQLGQPVPDALDGVVEALGEAARPLVSALTSSERYGTPLLPELERVASEARLVRRRNAEVAARRLPVQLLFPLVLCTLPAFVLLTVVPLLVGAVGTLDL